MSGVTASRGEMMQVTPDVARDQREADFSFLSFFCKNGEAVSVLGFWFAEDQTI